ncbi:putative uncharacterized protein [Clostridium sp. CAG:253]|nr:putative uncharacterized protein [Clostridium sp. CAG:253]
MDDMNVYVSILHDSLRKKLEIITEILYATRQQKKLLSIEKITDLDTEEFDRIVDDKQKLIEEMTELDKGFDSVFKKVGIYLSQNKYAYQSRILEMQNLIRSITDVSVELQSLEQQNKNFFNKFLREKRHEISSFKTSNKVAVSYYQNMSNQHREWQSHFLDQRK